jgi:hypothetical protein
VLRLRSAPRRFLLGLLVAAVTFGCIGRATPPEQVKLTQKQNEVLGKFARQVGENELAIMLKDPYDATLPGLPVGDLLYILDKTQDEDKLIRLVKGIGATATLELIIAIKRVGCTRINDNPVVGQYTFDARTLTGANGLNNCKYNHFHLPNIMVQLLNGANANGLTTLIDTVRHNYPELTALGTNQALLVSLPNLVGNTTYNATVSHYSFLMKLAYIVAGFDAPTNADPNLSGANLVGPTKLYNLMNLTMDGRDMVFLLDSFDKNACPGVGATNSFCVNVDTANVLTTYDGAGNLWNDITSNFQFQGLQNLLSIMNLVTDTSKMGTIVNGRRTTRYATGEDQEQVRYYVDRLKVLLEHDSKLTKPVACYDGTAGTLYNTVTGTAAERQLQDYDCPQGGNTEWNQKLAGLINLITNVNRMMDLVYSADDGWDIPHTFPITYAAPNRGIDNLLVMVNNLNRVAVHNAPNTTNNELITAAYLIDNISPDVAPTFNANPAKRNKVKYLVEYMGTTLDVLKLACYTAVSDQVDGVAPADATPETCDDRGLINQAADGSKVDDAAVADLTAAGKKLANLLGQITEIDDMRFLVNKVSMSNMTKIISGLQIASTINVANLVNQINGNDCWNESNGAIAATMGAAGAGYTSRPTVTFTGGGAGALGRAIIETDAVNFAATVGQVKGVVVIGGGTGYTAGAVTLGGGGGAGATATFGVGNCNFNPPTAYRGFPTATATGATGLGKMVNVINHITGSPTSVITLINGVTDGNKLGILINGISRSSNLVGVLNGVVDASRNNNATITDMIALLNTISREDTYKMVHMLENFGDAREVDSLVTVPSGDHDMVAQLFASYNQANISTTSGVGTAAMAELVGALTLNGGQGYANGTALTIAGGGGAGAAASIVTTAADTVSGVTITGRGTGCTAAPTVSFSGGGGSGAAATAYIDTVAQQLLRVVVTNAGSGYTTVPTVTFSGGCTTAPTGTATTNRVGNVTIGNPGAGFTGNPTTCSVGGGVGASLTCIASGGINTTPSPGLNGLTSLYGGTGYGAGGAVCPIVGAGGTGATCTVTTTGGVITGCSAVTGGSNYASGRIVKIGGRAEAVTTVTGGIVTGVTVTNSGCNYGGVPVVEVIGCTTPPALTATVVAGRVTAITGFPSGTGCPVGAKVVIGENPFVAFGDGASAVVGAITGGTLTSVSVSEPAVNAAQLIQLIDRDPTGLTSGTRGFSITYNSTTPNISAREAMVRLLHHGVTPSNPGAKSQFNGAGGIGPGLVTMSWPGLGPQHIAGSILNNLSGVTATQTLINMMNANTIDLVDTVILLGCGDHSTYANVVGVNTWQQLCTALGPGIW